MFSNVTEEGCERYASSLWLIFLFFYRNGDGFVDREEFGEILHLTGEAVTEEDIDEMFGESDTNKDGKIDFDGKTCCITVLLLFPQKGGTHWTSSNNILGGLSW